MFTTICLLSLTNMKKQETGERVNQIYTLLEDSEFLLITESLR